jgi:hypothetical protein
MRTFPTYTAEQKAQFRAEGLVEIREYVEKWIGDPKAPSRNSIMIQQFVMKCLEAAPLYFWYIPSSMTGKYHPNWGLGEGGLLRHVVFGMYNAYELADTFGLTIDQRDIAVAAMALHDTCKYGLHDDPDEGYYNAHPVLPRILYASPRHEDHQFHKEIPLAAANAIFDAIETHMGNIAKGGWVNIGSEGPNNRFRPQSSVEIVVHLADYNASRPGIYFADFLPPEITSQEGI